MIRRIPSILVALIVILLVAGGFRSPHPSEPYDLSSWGRLPVLDAGRLKPMDTLARTRLMQLRGKQSIPGPEDKKITALEWLFLVLYEEDKADSLPSFRIDEPDLVSLLGYSPDEKKYFSFEELRPHLNTIERQFQQVNPEPSQRNRYERALMLLYGNITVYQGLGLSFKAPGMGIPLSTEVARYRTLLHLMEANPDVDKGALNAFGSRYRGLAKENVLSVIPPQEQEESPVWRNLWKALLINRGEYARAPGIDGYIKLAEAAEVGDAEAFNAAVRDLLTGPVGKAASDMTSQLNAEYTFNAFAPFYRSMLLYVIVFLLVCMTWIRMKPAWQHAAFWALVAAFILHSLGLGARMFIHGRPPVTNLYSSAVFMGWAAAGLSLILERIYRNGIGSGMAAAVGFASLLVAHHLSLGGDTIEQMRAVLNDNFWLTTHVITITLGYSAAFMAGFVAIIFLIRAILSRGVGAREAHDTERMVYGTLCFTLLFSFIGTVLGGIWADQSWGRFWGWDPKENGALLIVIWNAFILHSFRCNLFARRGLMVLAVSGNIVTSWSWFGTNMLGIGLHSYGFMDQAFKALMLFWISQCLIMAFAALIPVRFWRSQEAVCKDHSNM